MSVTPRKRGRPVGSRTKPRANISNTLNVFLITIILVIVLSAVFVFIYPILAWNIVDYLFVGRELTTGFSSSGWILFVITFLLAIVGFATAYIKVWRMWSYIPAITAAFLIGLFIYGANIRVIFAAM